MGKPGPRGLHFFGRGNRGERRGKVGQIRNGRGRNGGLRGQKVNRRRSVNRTRLKVSSHTGQRGESDNQSTFQNESISQEELLTRDESNLRSGPVGQDPSTSQRHPIRLEEAISPEGTTSRVFICPRDQFTQGGRVNPDAVSQQGAIDEEVISGDEGYGGCNTQSISASSVVTTPWRPNTTPRRRAHSWRDRFDRGRGNASNRRNPGPPPFSSPPVEDPERIRLEIVQYLPTFDEYFNKRLPELTQIRAKVGCVLAYLTKVGFDRDVNSQAALSCDTYERMTELEFEMDIDEVAGDADVSQAWPDLVNDLTNFPEDTIAIWSACGQTFVHSPRLQSDYFGFEKAAQSVRFAFKKTNPVIYINDIRAEKLGKYIVVQGIITKSGELQLHCNRMTFKCRLCGKENVSDMIEGRFMTPASCDEEECNAKRPTEFEPIENSSKTRLVPSKRFCIQEGFSSTGENGAIPRALDCVVYGNRSKQLETGDSVMISGVLRMKKENRTGKLETLHSLYLEVCSFMYLRENGRTLGGNLLTMSDADHRYIMELQNERNLFRKLVNSICPSIVGNELVKAGLLLAILGGSPPKTTFLPTRPDINVLMVGNPSRGKSKLLKFASEAAPKGFFVSNTSSTSCGLTVTMTKTGDEYTLEPGAVVIASGGTLCIDELDKLKANFGSLLECLEQQCVSISKCGVSRTLPAKTSILAAANPIGGTYNNDKTLLENINLGEALTSRFDLVFIMNDSSDAEMDKRLTDHLFRFQDHQILSTSSGSRTSSGRPMLLQDRLKNHRWQAGNFVRQRDLRMFIAYAKHTCTPVLSSAAKEILRRYYLHIRLGAQSDRAYPVTPRVLESLVRLTQARAKVELSNEATIEMAEDAIELFDFCFAQVQNEPTPKSLSLSSTNKPRNPTAKHLHEALQKLAVNLHKRIFSIDEIRDVLESLGCSDKEDRFLSILNNAGIIIKRSARVWELLGPV